MDGETEHTNKSSTYQLLEKEFLFQMNATEVPASMSRGHCFNQWGFQPRVLTTFVLSDAILTAM
jgi:hypothetical protein